MSIRNKRGYVVSLYRSPSQTQDEFDIFLVSFEQLIGDIIAKNPLFVLITSDFNVRSKSTTIEVRGVFLDLSKVFGKVWHEDLLYKLKNHGINGNALQLIE